VPPGVGGAGLRHPRPGTGHGFYGGGYYGGGYYGYPYYGYGYGYPYFGLGFGYPFYDNFYGGYGYGYPYYYGYGYGAPGYGYGYPNNDYYGGGEGNPNGYGGGGYSSERRGVGYFRLMVDPTDTEVFVDDKPVGTVDDFNGYTHHLALRSGEHVITLQRDGYKTHRVQVFVRPGMFQKVRYDMVKGTGEDQADVMTRNEPPRDNERDGDRDVQVAPSSTSGALELDVQPQDATVYVDGEFKGIGREAGNLELPEGRHRVEVVRPGFRTFTTEIDVTSNRPAQLTIELERP
jgi:hypothetical protein